MSRIILLMQEEFNRSIENILQEIKILYKPPAKLYKCPKFVLGISGGPDSMAMLYLFYNLSLHKNIKVIVAHFNHMIRKEEAIRDEHFVIDISKKLNLNIIVGRLKLTKVKVNEAYLREKRFAFFTRILKKEQPCFLALAHIKDDNLETVFMNLLEGKVLKPNLGINRYIKLTDIKNSFLIHPMIDFNRNTILEFVMDNNIPYVIDSSNLRSDYLRNYIRHKIFPVFKTYKNSFFYSLENIQKRWETFKK